MGLDGIGVDAVVELGEREIQVPCEGEAAVFVLLEALEFLDEVEFEIHRNLRGELEGDVFMGKHATVAPGF